MKGSFEELSVFIDKILENEPIDPSAIPNIDLYMDQVTSFMEDHLSGYKRMPEDKILTKTMINNYTKDKVLPPPDKKKYTKYHTILLILVYHLKQSLSISDIVKLLNPVSLEQAEDVYKMFIQQQTEEHENLHAAIRQKFKKAEEHTQASDENRRDILLLILSLVIDANLKKQLACQLIDAYFPNPTPNPPQKQR